MALTHTTYLRPEARDKLLDQLERGAIVARARGHRLPVRDHMLFTMLLAAGTRPTEMARAAVGALHLGREPRITITRLKRRKAIVEDAFLPGALKGALADYLSWMKASGLSTEPSAPLFPGRDGKPMTRSGIFRRWKAALRAAGLPEDVELRATRHTCAVSLYRATRDLKLVQRHLGHASVSSTQVYADVLPEDVQAGVNAAWR